MRRKRLIKNKFKNMSFFKKNVLVMMASLVLVCFTMVGYATLNQTLNITGDLVLRAKKDIRITNLNILETGNNGYEKYNSKFTPDTITVITNLEKAGDSITYQATITNKGDMDMMVTNIDTQVSGITDSVNLVITDLEKDDVIAKGELKTFTIKLERTTDVTLEEMEVGLVIDLDWEESGEKYLAYRIEGNSIYKGAVSIMSETYISPDGHTNNGITYTVNDDGSITANGTATANSKFDIANIEVEAGKTYIFGPAPVGASSTTYRFVAAGQHVIYDTNVSVSFTEATTVSYAFYVIKGATVENLTFYPQVIEGTSPDNRKEIQSVGDKTHNLFNQASTKTATFATFANTTARDFEEGVWYLGLTYNNYSNVNNLADYRLEEYSTMVNGGEQLIYGLAQAFKVEPNQKYSLSYNEGTGGRIGFGFYDAGGNFLSYKTISSNSTITIPENTYWMTVCLGTPVKDTEFVYSNIQLVLGSEIPSYEPYGKYKIEIEYSGKNLVTGLINGYPDTTNFPALTTPTSKVFQSVLLKNLKAGTYTCSFERPVNIIRSMSTNYHSTQTAIKPSSTMNTISTTFTLTQDEELYYLSFRDTTSSSTPWDGGWVQCEEGSVATEYMPGPIIETIYLDEPLRKVGTYVDYIDFKNGKLYRNVSEILLNGSEVWNVATANYGYRAYISDSAKTISPIVAGVGLSNRFNITKGLSKVGHFITRTAGGIQFAQDWAATKDEWATWVTANNIVIQYPIAEETYNLQLAEILKEKGYTDIKINTSVQPSKFTYEFEKK